MAGNKSNSAVTRRNFLVKGAATGVVSAAQSDAQAAAPHIHFDHVADVVIIGAGASGLAAAIMARDHGASVIAIDSNSDIGGHAMVSGGHIPLGGGTSLQKKHGIADSADRVYLDHTYHRNRAYRFGDRDLIRMWADENAPTFEFLIENGVLFEDAAPTVVNGGSVPRDVVTRPFSTDLKETINGSPGSGLVRHLEASAKAKGVQILLRHRMTRILRASPPPAGPEALSQAPAAGRVVGIVAAFDGKSVNLQARRGVVIATGGHTSNVDFRRIFDPRLTAEYQVAGEPWTRQMAEGELAAMDLGASLWATSNVANEVGYSVTKTIHIGCRYGYRNLKWNPASPIFDRAGASGLTVQNFQDVILVNRVGRRFWNELDGSYDFLNACLGPNGKLDAGPDGSGGGPIWAIFDAAAVQREQWDPRPPHIDPNGWFFAANTLAGLAREIANPFQFEPLPADALEQTVTRYNGFVDAGKDLDFAKPGPQHKIETPPFYAAWSTPILHDCLTGLRIDRKCRVIDIHGRVIPGLYCAGESAGGFALHGLPRVLVFGRVAGREAALAKG